MAVGCERARDKFVIWFDLPEWPTRIKIGTGERYTAEKREQYEKKKGLREQIQSWIGAACWQQLLERFPASTPLRRALERKLGGAALTMDAMLDQLIEYWELGTAGKKKCQRKAGNIAKDVCRVSIIRKYFNPTLEKDKGEYAAQVDELRLKQFRGKMLKDGYSAGYINRCLAHILTAFNKIGRLHRLPVPVLDTIKLGEAPPREDFWTRPEVDRLVAELPEWDRAQTMCGYFTGWRLDEILSRKVSDLKVRDGQVFLFLDADHSKNGEERWWPMALYPEFQQILERQVAYVRELGKSMDRVIEWLFPNPRTGERLHSYYEAFRGAVERAGLTVDPRTGERWVHSKTGEDVARLFHGFRRTAHRNLRDDFGMPEDERMKLIGHKTAAMARRYEGTADASVIGGIAERALERQSHSRPQSASNVVAFVQHSSNGAK
jgi:integrase